MSEVSSNAFLAKMVALATMAKHAEKIHLIKIAYAFNIEAFTLAELYFSGHIKEFTQEGVTAIESAIDYFLEMTEISEDRLLEMVDTENFDELEDMLEE
jgi:hypothetical protein